MGYKFLLGSKEDFYNFINLISEKDKIGIVTHTDLDGIASAIFLQKILESRSLEIDFIECLDHGANVLEGVLNKKFDVLFFTDWNVDDYSEYLKKLKKKGKVFVIDHHPFDKELKNETNFIKTSYEYCSSHCLFDLAKSKDYFNTEEWGWLVCSAIIADYVWDKLEENFEFIKSFYPTVKKDSSIWNSEPGMIGKLIKGASLYYSSNLRKVYDLVLEKDLTRLEKANEEVTKEVERWVDKINEEIEYFREGNLIFVYGEPKYNIVSTVASIISDRDFRGDVVVFCAELKDKKEFVKVSAREQTGIVDVRQLLKKCVEGFENSSAGGHVRAAAGTFPKKYLNEFRNRLLNELK